MIDDEGAEDVGPIVARERARRESMRAGFRGFFVSRDRGSWTGGLIEGENILRGTHRQPHTPARPTPDDMAPEWFWDASGAQAKVPRYVPYGAAVDDALNEAYEDHGDKMKVLIHLVDGGANKAFVYKHHRRGWIQERQDDAKLWRAVVRRGAGTNPSASAAGSADGRGLDRGWNRRKGIQKKLERTYREAHY